MNKIRVTVWNEHTDNQLEGKCFENYPKGMHAAIADFLNAAGSFEAKTAELREPEHGLTQEVIDNTDVLIWWGHMAHHGVSDEVVKRVCEAVLSGMGVIFLHSAHLSKPFIRLMGTTGTLKWREHEEENVRLWFTSPGHPIVKGLGEYIDIPHDEMYGEYFDIPQPDELIFISWFKGGNVFRGGCTWKRGRGKVFYFNPGHETFPVYRQKEVQQLLANAARWAFPDDRSEKPPQLTGGNALEKL